MATNSDVIVIGAGLAGLVATYELVRAGRSVTVVEQENANNLGGQAFWSLGGLFMVNTPEQRRLGIRDSYDLALQDWLSSAAFDRDHEDAWGERWAHAYVEFASGEMREYLHTLGLRLFPFVAWAERGSGVASGHGNSVPRFHLTWGTGPEVVRIFAERVADAEREGQVVFRYRHQVDEIVVTDGVAGGVRGTLLEPSELPRGVKSSRVGIGHFELNAQAVIVASGGIGGNPDLVRENWPARLGNPPARMLSGVPAHVDGRMVKISEDAGAKVVNRDRMWHYPEGIANWNPVWPNHAIRILPGPSSLWLDATGKRLPAPLFPGFDNMAAFGHIARTGFGYSWFLLDQTIIEKEFALSGSEQNPDFTGKSIRAVLGRVRKGATGPVEAFKNKGVDFVVRDNLRELVEGMNAITDEPLLSYPDVEREVIAHDRELNNSYSKDQQITAVRAARRFLTDRLLRVAKPHKLLDPRFGPLIAVRLNLLTRKTLGGLQTTLDSRVNHSNGTVFPGLYAAGEVAGFGGGGMHGYNALEGSFLGGCIFSGRAAGRAVAEALR